MPFPFGVKKSNKTVKLTPTGNEKLLAMMPQGYEFTVMKTVKKHEPSCSVEEIARELNWQPDKVEHILDELHGKGWVEKAN